MCFYCPINNQYVWTAVDILTYFILWSDFYFNFNFSVACFHGLNYYEVALVSGNDWTPNMHKPLFEPTMTFTGLQTISHYFVERVKH